MIELVFVIVILGILSAIALSKLSATRDDARLSQMAKSISISIGEVVANAVARGIVPSSEAEWVDASKNIASLRANGLAVVTGSNDVEFAIGGVSDCLVFHLAAVAGVQSLTIVKPASSVELCQRLQGMFANSAYPLRGGNVNYD
uniref:type II secretion system protein n=1 Tax=Thiomicrolovo subterrani TaxID=3131934 RepID=UPI003F619171